MIEKPPSTGIAVPVTKSDAGEARNTAIPAKSEISPQRPAGVRASTRSWRPLTSTRARLVRSVSIQPRQDRIGLDASGSPGAGASAGELDDAALARGISGREARPEDRHHRTDIDDLAATAALHGGMDRLAAQEGAGEIGVDHARPLVVLEQIRRLADVDAGIVDEDVDAAEFARHASDHGIDRIPVGDVGGHGNRLDATGCEIGYRLLGFRRIAPDNGERCSSATEAAGHAQPDTAIAAGDDGDPAAEIERCCCHCRSYSRE